MFIPPQLRKLYEDGRLLPFVGAGISMSVAWTQEGIRRRGPSWSELVDEAARQLGFEMPELARIRGTDLQILEYFKVKNQGEFAKLTNWMVKNMSAPDDALRDSTIHRELALMDKCEVFYTTNFDDFLERGLAVHGRQCDVVASEADMGLRTSGCEVVKFHGDLNHPNMMVLSESHYEERLAFKAAMDYRLRSDVLGRAVLFIGYSFRDPNVSYLFRLVNEQFKTLPISLSGKRAYIATPDPSDFEISLFDQRNIEVLATSGSDMTDGITELLRAIRT